jgi:hypothetical protein
MGGELREIRDEYEDACGAAECTGVLLEKEREVMMEYVTTEFIDRRAMEMARCFVQNVLRFKKEKAIKQFAMIPREALTGRLNPQRNMITDLVECDKTGISPVVSHARFMGALATVLKCNTTLFKMDTIRRLLNDTEWRFSDRFNTVQQDAIDDLLGVFHAYIVGTRVCNPARTWTPNIQYTYGLYASQDPKTMRRDFCTILEKIPFLPQQATIGDMIRRGKLTQEVFLSVLAQLALALEIQQSRAGFVHYDLHTENVMMRPVYDKTVFEWSYDVYGNEYKLGAQFVATIVALGSACFNPVLLETGNVDLDAPFVGRGAFRKQGVMDFMIPGYDLFVFLNRVRLLILSTIDPSNLKNFVMDPYAQENNLMILDFIDHIFLTIYEVPETMVVRNGVATTTEGRDYKMYNVLLCKGAAVSPLALLQRLDAATIKSKLRIAKLPWTVMPRKNYLPTYCKKKVPAFLADIMPNWKKIVEEERFFHPVALTSPDEIVRDLDTMIDILKNKKMFYEFDARPLMTQGDQISPDAMEFYDRLVFDKKGMYHNVMLNTVLFYNTAIRFLDTYYYASYSNDKDRIEMLRENQDKITILMRYIQKPEFMPKVASIVRFAQTIVQLKKMGDRKFCCAATRQQSLGQLAQQQRQSSNSKLQVDSDIYKIQAQKSVCQNKNPDPLLTPDVYPLPKQQKQQQFGVRLQQQLPIVQQKTQQQLPIVQQKTQQQLPIVQQQQTKQKIQQLPIVQQQTKTQLQLPIVQQQKKIQQQQLPLVSSLQQQKKIQQQQKNTIPSSMTTQVSSSLSGPQSMNNSVNGGV